jgi:CheY-like chemotaxis protein
MRAYFLSKTYTSISVMNDFDNSTTEYSNVILIAEDEEINYHFLAMLLNKLKPGCELLHAKDGVEAVNLYKEHQGIQLILMDIKMPNMDGYEATRQIKSLNTGVKIIAQTALSAYDAKEKALQAGCDDFITKPIDKSLLENSINHLSKPSA